MQSIGPLSASTYYKGVKKISSFYHFLAVSHQKSYIGILPLAHNNRISIRIMIYRFIWGPVQSSTIVKLCQKLSGPLALASNPHYFGWVSREHTIQISDRPLLLRRVVQGVRVGVLGEIRVSPPGPPWEVAVLPRRFPCHNPQQKYHRIHDFSYTTVIKMLSTLVYILAWSFSMLVRISYIYCVRSVPFVQWQLAEGLVNKL